MQISYSKHIYNLMEKDSFNRFRKTEIYHNWKIANDNKNDD